jgi:hypothetical protein
MRRNAPSCWRSASPRQRDDSDASQLTPPLFQSVLRSSGCRAEPPRHWFAVPIATACTRHRPGNSGSEQQRRSDRECQYDGTPPRVCYRFPGASDGRIDPPFRIGTCKACRCRNQLDQVASILIAHSRMARRSQKNTARFRTLCRKIYIGRTADGSEHPIDLIA